MLLCISHVCLSFPPIWPCSLEWVELWVAQSDFAQVYGNLPYSSENTIHELRFGNVKRSNVGRVLTFAQMHTVTCKHTQRACS